MYIRFGRKVTLIYRVLVILTFRPFYTCWLPFYTRLIEKEKSVRDYFYGNLLFRRA